MITYVYGHCLSRLRCLEKHQGGKTCLRKTEVLMFNIKDNNMEWDWRDKDATSSRYYESNTEDRKPNPDIEITSKCVVRRSRSRFWWVKQVEIMNLFNWLSEFWLQVIRWSSGGLLELHLMGRKRVTFYHIEVLWELLFWL